SSPLVAQTLRRALQAERTRHVLDAGGGIVRDAQYSPDGTRILTTDDASVFDAKTGKLLKQLARPGEVTHAAFSPDGPRIATASTDHKAWIWDAATFKLIAMLDQRGPIASVAFSPNGRLVLTAGSNQTVKLWTAAGKLRGIIRLTHAVN